jgi:UDP-2,3-diacylglucosamine hydrolase
MSVSDTDALAQPEAVALFVSDLHLQESMPRTTQAFFDFLDGQAMWASQLYLLGDLFEYWAGDDDLATPFNQQIVDAIRAVSDHGVTVFWMPGNRDFLAGAAFAKATGARFLPDPFVATIVGQRLVLAHGDAQCTDDTSYMAFRAQVRQQNWRDAFLALPLAQRKSIIDGMRKNSRAAQADKPPEIMDVNAAAIESLFENTGASLMVHGHTHRPARHEYSQGGSIRVRQVLPDWDCDVTPRRGGWLSIRADGSIERVNLIEAG